ncbi:MAG TPA: ABC transporter ATP-binding protein [Candidatus Hydrogenedentes bacterium]|nr:ABC transporter ATP-binding protein [Candidatus Hydrogenedentota bacterium]
MTEGYHIDDELPQRSYDGRLMRRLLSYTRPYRNSMLAATGLLLLLSVLNNITPLLIMRAVDRYINNPARALLETDNTADAEAINAVMAVDARGLTLVVAALGALMIGQAVVRYSQVLLVSVIGQKCMYDMRLELFNHIQRQPLRFIDRNPVGRLLNRITNDIEKIQQTIVGGVVAVISDMLTIVVVLFVMLYVNWQLALVALCPVPFILATSVIFRKYAQHSFLEARRKIARITAWMQEHISGMAIVQLFGREAFAYQEFKRRNAAHRDEWLRQVRNFAVYFPTVEFFSSLSTALIILYCGVIFMMTGAEQSGLASVGTIFAFILLAERFFGPIRALADRYNLLLEAMAASERVFTLLDTAPEIQDLPGSLEAPRFEGMIDFDGVWFAYDEESVSNGKETQWILRDITFHVQPGEHVAVVGHTGAGKSTLLNLLARFYECQQGAIRIDNRDIRDYQLRSLRKQIGIVLQEPFLFSGTIEANIRLGNAALTMERIRECAAYVNADGFIERMPGGYQYHVGERGGNLSTGQRQLIAFARTIAHDPAILALDEATSNVDSETEHLIQKAVEKLLRSRTSIVIAHRLSTIRNADRIIVMHHGRIRETGDHEELLARNGLYRTLYELQYAEQTG